MTDTCDACPGVLARSLPEVVDPQSGERFRVDRCSSCGLGHTRPLPENLAHYYGPAYHGGRHGWTAKLCFARRLRWLTHVSPRSRGARLLDVGCGDGGFLLAARRAGWTVFGTELDGTFPRAAGLEVERTLEAAARHGPFDAITFWHSLEHLVSPRRALEDVWQALAPGGQLLIAVPDAGGLQAKAFGADWFHLDVPRHLFHFDARSLERLLDRVGFTVHARWHAELEYDVMGWAQSALNRWAKKVPRNRFFEWATGRRSVETPARATPYLACGALLSTVGVPLSLLSAACGKGGTLVMAAQKA